MQRPLLRRVAHYVVDAQISGGDRLFGISTGQVEAEADGDFQGWVCAHTTSGNGKSRCSWWRSDCSTGRGCALGSVGGHSCGHVFGHRRGRSCGPALAQNVSTTLEVAAGAVDRGRGHGRDVSMETPGRSRRVRLPVRPVPILIGPRRFRPTSPSSVTLMNRDLPGEISAAHLDRSQTG